MASNTYKLPGSAKQQESFFSWLERVLRLDKFFSDGNFVKFMPHIAFVTVLGIIYIWNSHQMDKTIRTIDALEVEVADLRADYTTLKAAYMKASKQTEVAKRVKELGLIESIEPVKKIEVTD